MVYFSIGIHEDTKELIDSLYYSLRKEKKIKNYDELIKMLLVKYKNE